MHIKSIGVIQFSKRRHSAQSPAVIIASRRNAGRHHITLTRGPAVVRYVRHRTGDLRLAAAAPDRDQTPPWDRELSLALDRWVVAQEV
ncbi:MAG: hypothetical protein K9L65_01120, partial [Chromatiaceae bacterium]|nr:hypothetical protein [Chromatiaceae bacterium]